MNWNEFLGDRQVEVVKSASRGLVVYGTSDDLINPSEVLLTQMAANHLGGKPLFFYYPKGEEWYRAEKQLFAPYDPAPRNPEEAIQACGLEMPVRALSWMIQEVGLADFALGRAVEIIRPHRNREFRALSTTEGSCPAAPWLDFTLGDLISHCQLKLGGAVIYFIYGAFLSRTGFVGVVPRKQFGDVLGAFIAGVEYAGSKAKIFPTGEFELATQIQWKGFERTKGWCKAPPWVAVRLWKHPAWMGVRLRLLGGEYCPVCYDYKQDSFSLWKPQLFRFEGRHYWRI